MSLKILGECRRRYGEYVVERGGTTEFLKVVESLRSKFCVFSLDMVDSVEERCEERERLQDEDVVGQCFSVTTWLAVGGNPDDAPTCLRRRKHQRQPKQYHVYVRSRCLTPTQPTFSNAMTLLSLREISVTASAT